MYENTPSAKDIFQKLDYFSLWIKMFWNRWYGFIAAYDIMEVIDGRQKTEYSMHKAGKDLQNSSLLSSFHQRGERKSREHPGMCWAASQGGASQDGNPGLPPAGPLYSSPPYFLFFPNSLSPVLKHLFDYSSVHIMLSFLVHENTLSCLIIMRYPLFTRVIHSPVSPLDTPRYVIWSELCKNCSMDVF